jgi:hypothetical protein
VIVGISEGFQVGSLRHNLVGYFFPLSLVGMNPFGALIVFLIADALMVFGAT